MKPFILITLMFFSLFVSAQQLNQKMHDEKRNNEMLIGNCNREGFKTIQSDFDSVYNAGYAAYTPDAATIATLKSLLSKKIKITVVMATWCGDSKDWIPRFYKVMDLAGFDYKNLSLICVDYVKKAPVKGLEKLKIEKVPTFIVYRKKHEKGRIIEVPTDLIEKDLVKILQ